jgi:hypothetical protein
VLQLKKFQTSHGKGLRTKCCVLAPANESVVGVLHSVHQSFSCTEKHSDEEEIKATEIQSMHGLVVKAPKTPLPPA